jgi:hypothetical protein
MLAPISLALFGGFVSLLNTRKKKSLTFFEFISGLATAGFVGIIMWLILSQFNMPDELMSATCGIAGYTSRDLIVIISDKFLHRAAKELERYED